MSRHAQDWACVTCAAVLGTRTGREFSVTDLPDLRERSEPAVDLVVASDDGSVQIAIEHTIVEAFPEQIRDGREIDGLLSELPTELAGRLPVRGRFDLSLAPYAVRGARKKDLAVMTDWILRVAPELEMCPPTSVAPRHCAYAEPPTLPVPATLYRWDMAPHGVLRAIEGTTEDQRRGLLRKSVEQSLDAKLPKLSAEKRRGCMTALVLERVEIALMNIPAITEALKEAIGDATTPRAEPDWVLLFETEFGPTRTVSVLKEGASWWPDVGPPDRYTV